MKFQHSFPPGANLNAVTYCLLRIIGENWLSELLAFQAKINTKNGNCSWLGQKDAQTDRDKWS
jgi:hypothetical protein